MLDLAQAVRQQIVKETPPRRGEIPTSFALRSLRPLAVWGATAAVALLLAVLSSRSEVGVQRIATMLHAGRAQAAPPAFDGQAETRRLAEAVRGLAADGNQIKTRLSAVEQDVGEVTGSVKKEIEAADAARQTPPPIGPTTSAIAAATIAMVPVTPPRPAAAPPRSLADAGAPSSDYAVDIGSGLTIEALRARWLAIYSAHPQMFEGLRPIVGVKEIPHGNKVELRLVVGPLAQAAAATQLCASLTQLGLFCQPTIFDGQSFALR